MDEGRLGLNDQEVEVLRRSADSEVTRRRIRQVVFFASFFGVLLLVVGPLVRSWPLLLAVSLEPPICIWFVSTGHRLETLQ